MSDKSKYNVEADIRKAETLAASFYQDQAIYDHTLEAVFAPSWQYLGHEAYLPQRHYVYPFKLLPGSLDEPLLLLRDGEDQVHCLSNVCTHRANILCTEAGTRRLIRCGYHGRCFSLEGKMRSMPCFEEAENFPSAKDNLPSLPLANLGPLLFGQLTSGVSFEAVFAPLLQRLAWFPFEALQAAPDYDQDYEVQAHWALYCDNYLEGFHVPFVHPSLNTRLDTSLYRSECFTWGSLQLGLAEADNPCFELPSQSPDYGKAVFAYYYWFFPNLMLNIYPWGISLNVVEPLGLDKCRVRFKTFRLPQANAADILASDIHQTEMEDELVVQQVQEGLRSRLYQGGRFSPSQEQGVHHFHRLLANVLHTAF